MFDDNSKEHLCYLDMVFQEIMKVMGENELTYRDAERVLDRVRGYMEDEVRKTKVFGTGRK